MRIKVNLNEINEDPCGYARKIEIPILICLLRKANDSYYNTDQSILKDSVYDILKDILQERKPDSTILKQIGIEIIDNDKEILPYHMGSMNKFKKPNNIKLWIKEYFGVSDNVVISDKLDGVSGLLVIKNNKMSLYSRGDSKYGRNISPLIEYINLPHIEGNYVIRGEIIITKTNFIKYSKDYSEARSLVNGICRTGGLNNHKNLNIDRCKDVDFVAYEIIEPLLSPLIQFKLLKKLGFIIPTLSTSNFIKFNDFNNNELMEGTFLANTLIKHKANSDYDIDGIIITVDKEYERNIHGNPEYSFAFKMNGIGIDATVTDVEWNISKHGQIIPKVRFNPIKIGGIKVERATGFHGKYIYDNRIGIGTKIKVIRSGDVIPYISDVVESSIHPKMPDIEYIWNESKVNLLVKNKDSNNELELKKLVSFFRNLGIENMNTGIITKLYQNGYNNINKILDIKVENLLELTGVKQTLANKLYNSIHKIIDNPIDIPIIMTASLIFGHGFGIKRFRAILDKYPTILEFEQITLKMITDIEGFQMKTAKKFLSNLEDFHQVIDATPSIKNSISGNLFDNHRIVLTGFRDEKIQEFIEKFNGKITNNINSKTSMLIIKDETINNSKIEEAKKNNVIIITKKQFINKYLLN